MTSANSFSGNFDELLSSAPVSYSFYPGVKPNEEKRGAPRHLTRLDSSVLMTGVGTTATGIELYYVLQGQLRDVSISGLAVIISNGDLRQLQRLGESVKLLMMLPLPSPLQAIRVEAAPVRYMETGESQNRQVILGAQIVDMSGRDRIAFMEFINHHCAAEPLLAGDLFNPEAAR